MESVIYWLENLQGFNKSIFELTFKFLVNPKTKVM